MKSSAKPYIFSALNRRFPLHSTHILNFTLTHWALTVNLRNKALFNPEALLHTLHLNVTIACSIPVPSLKKVLSVVALTFSQVSPLAISNSSTFLTASRCLRLISAISCV